VSSEHPALVEFFATNRSRIEHLYPSERRFLPWLATSGRSVLDVGCATGGFADVWHAFNPTLRYTGVDASSALIDAARKQRPALDFFVGDCATGLPFPDHSAEIVQALGWLHWEPRYRDALEELWRVTGHRLFFDLRLHAGRGDLVGRQPISPTDAVPYICVSWTEILERLLELAPTRLLGFGYMGRPHANVSGAPEDVGFATFVLERSARTNPAGAEVCLDIPFEVPADSAARMALYPAARLRSFAPESPHKEENG
jgi:SAM-dependent methyltransferase